MSNNLFMQKLAELENQYNIDKQALREAREEIERAERMASEYVNARVIVSVCLGRTSVWVQGDEGLAIAATGLGELTKQHIGSKSLYLYKGVKVLEC